MHKGHIFLIGFMGTGKSAAARRLSERLSLQENDTDHMIEEQEGRKISEIFDSSGEEYFRRAETRLLEDLKDQDPMIISCGGGMAMRAENRDLMKEAGTVILLVASPETVLKRVRYDNNRPLLKGHKNVKDISELMEKRRAAYEAAADVIVDTDEKTVSQVADAIASEIAAFNYGFTEKLSESSS